MKVTTTRNDFPKLMMHFAGNKI